MFLARQVGRAHCRRFSVEAKSSSQSAKYKSFQFLRIEEHFDSKVLQVELNRPDKSNALTDAFWMEIGSCFEQIGRDHSVRAVVLSAAGKNFTAGLDLTEAASTLLGVKASDNARKALQLRNLILRYQNVFTAIERCSQPVIAAVHSACIGAGVDMISACDIRYCEENSWFAIKEVDIGLAADVGTLQRLPRVARNDSLLKELALTARAFNASEAKELGLVSRILPNKETLLQSALTVAGEIASKSPVAVVGTKAALNYARDHTVDEGLTFIANWNMAMLQTKDLEQAIVSAKTKKLPTFPDLNE